MRERAVVREMISVANEIAEAGFDPQGRTSEDLLDLAESRVFKIAESRANKDEGPKNIADVLDATVARIEQLFQQPHDGVTGVNTGYDDLNKKTAGLLSVLTQKRLSPATSHRSTCRVILNQAYVMPSKCWPMSKRSALTSSTAKTWFVTRWWRVS